MSIHDVLGKLGYRASCDFPATVYWSQQLERYPHAKVVLLERDAEEWYTSFMNTIGN